MKRLVFNLFFLTLFLATACIQAPANNRRTLSNNITGTKTPANTPVFTQGVNYFQNSGQIYAANLPLALDFKDTIYLRGKDIDSYIRLSGTQNSACLVTNFLTASKTLVVSAMPQSIYNFTNQSIEYYYAVSFSNSASNQNFCNKPGLTTALNGSLIYDIKSLCVNSLCNTSYSSRAFDLYSASGTVLPQINLKNLSLGLSPAAPISSGTGTTCVTNAQCAGMGLDCCSNGQCVKDLAIKTGVDQNAADYKQALQDILNNPTHVYLYPNFYYICSSPVAAPPIPPDTTNPVNVAMARLRNLENLYNCTTKISGEAGICAKTYPNATINTPYEVRADDLNFSGTYENITPVADTLVNVTEVIYGDIPLYNFANKTDNELYSFVYTDTATATTPAYVSIAGNHNNNVSAGAQVTLLALPTNAQSKDLVVKYFIDASCTEINSSLAKCEKYYVQGQQNGGSTILANRLGRVTDHYPASNFFKLPSYANTNKSFTVELDGITLKQDIDWQLKTSSPPTIELKTTNGTLKAYITQKVKISFFVDLLSYNVMASKKSALNEIKTICSCPSTNCSLAPVKNTIGAVMDYVCVYPDPPPPVVPTSQLIYLSSKTVPVRYFDNTGASQSAITGSTAAQEGRPFSYIKNDPLVPNNMPSATITDPYVGFNEIYGSLTYGANSAKPAKEVNVKVGSSYDIYVDRGAYSTCTLCGNDYYSQLNKLFPTSQFGLGLAPNRSQTDSKAVGIRADDYAFGRACFVPATMIPWTHAIDSIVIDQRQNRMRAQHFLYANGYQRDWFGFNYGSVIGSFDGVKWFSIGTNRRIKAQSSKLFLAVNGSMGDLTIENTYNVTVNDATLNPSGYKMVTNDFDSDGAQCQRFHQCDNDTDCATTLGWDYMCAPINEKTTPWPVFDSNAGELPDAQAEDRRLVSILGINTGGKRCVYRGRGAACTQNSSATNLTTNLLTPFNESQSESFHTCSNNNFCQTLSTANSFNNRIVRFGKVKTDSTVDSVGLGARVPQRPLDYNGQETIRTEPLVNLIKTNVTSICKPGRNPETDITLQNKTAPPSTGTYANIYNGDKILGMGMSFRKDYSTNSGTDANYLSTCSIFDDLKNYYYGNISGLSAGTGDGHIKLNAGSQAISTNALDVFTSIFTSKGMTVNLLINPTSIITGPVYQENRCLRAPGASCFQDLECAPNKAITDKTKLLVATDTTMHAAELKFWQEELVCSQAMAKTDLTYDPAENRCCREVGKTISIASSNSTATLAQITVPGIDIPISNVSRYSRLATIYKELNTEPTTYPPLAIATTGACSGACASLTPLENQYNTFDLMAKKTSCSGHWVRNFATGINNHKWDKTSLQTIDSSTFRCFNWRPNTQNNKCTAANIQDETLCSFYSTSLEGTKARGVLDFLGKLELTGIPQIAIESQSAYTQGDAAMTCLSNPNDSSQTYSTYMTPNNIWSTAPAAAEYIEAGSQYYAANNITNFATPKIKQVFKSDEVVACLPAGTVVKSTDDPNLCCTGFSASVAGVLQCALKDFVDVSVYTNRYVSSEASSLNIDLFDSSTGYINDPMIAANFACQKKMCASGTIILGVLISKMVITGAESIDKPETRLSRFLEGQKTSDDLHGELGLYNQGLKLNNHAYCFPKSSAGQAGQNKNLMIIPCGY